MSGGATIRQGLEQKAARARAEDTAKWLTSLPDDQFEELVSRELRGLLDADVADVLGHPLCVNRWRGQLKAMQTSIQMQYAERVGPEWADWRRKARWFEQRVRERRAAAKHADIWARRESAESAAALRAERRQQMRDAGDRAINRLIEAHRDEFDRLLAEEKQRTA